MMHDADLLPRLFADLKPQAPDPVLSLIALHRDDPRPEKIDLGVGVYRDERGATPVFKAVKAAETLLVHEQTTKSYLGPEGDLGFLARIASIVFGERTDMAELVSVQTPGGTGALRLAADLVAAGQPGGRVWLGTPSWPIHARIFRQAGLDVKSIPYFDAATQSVRFDRLLSELDTARPGDMVLLQGACHNPTGVDLTLEQWAALADLIQRRGAIPLIDLAYQGLGDGLERDAAGLRLMMDACETVAVAQSCDKNFGLYRERVGALFVRTRRSIRELVRSNLFHFARCAWSMPPDHGAAVVRTILQSEHLSAQWRSELNAMRRRLNEVRAALADAVPQLEPLRRQRGLFALLPLGDSAIETLRRDHAVYMAGSGRINIAGLTRASIPRFTRALAAVL